MSHAKHSVSGPSLRLAVVAIVALGASSSGCAPAADGDQPAGDPGTYEQQSDGITVRSCSESAILGAAPTNARPFITRALNWVNRHVPYSQTPQASCGGYRTDCSGLVSYAWGLPAPGHTTYSFAGGPWDDHRSVRLPSNNSLVIGDAMNWPGNPGAGTGHIRLFAGWLDSAHTHFCSIEEFDFGYPAEVRDHYVDPAFLPIRLAGWHPVNAAWGGQFVSQSFPYASAGVIRVHAGSSVNVSITMKNIGGQAWDSSTRLATTEPRNRASRFAAPSWIAPDRPAEVHGTVPHGANYRFAFTLEAPRTLAPGRYPEHWGMVQEHVTWFSNPSEGGPVDNLLEGIVEVLPPLPAGDGGTAGGAGYASDPNDPDAAVVSDDAERDASDDAASSDDADGGESSVETPSGAMPAACSVTRRAGGAGGGRTVLLGLACALVVACRRRRGSRHCR